MRCQHGVPAGDPSGCRACEDIAERRASGEDREFTVEEWDRLEAGPLWNTYPGMGSA